VKGNALRGRTFDSAAAQNQHLQTWELAVADARIRGTTRKRVSKLFEELEKPALLALPPGRFPRASRKPSGSSIADGQGRRL
jgi:hypothetical protein